MSSVSENDFGGTIHNGAFNSEWWLITAGHDRAYHSTQRELLLEQIPTQYPQVKNLNVNLIKHIYKASAGGQITQLIAPFIVDNK